MVLDGGYGMVPPGERLAKRENNVKSILGILLLSLSMWVASGHAEDLVKVEAGQGCHGPVYLYYRADCVTPILKPIPLEYDNSRVLVAKVVLEQGSRDTLIIEFSDGPSCDPGFLFYWSDGRRIETERPDIGPHMFAMNLAIPGDGCFYTWGHTNSHFDIHRKFHLVDSVLCEVEQPYYYVGMKTVALKDLTLYGDLDDESIAATVCAGDSITVLLYGRYSFLVKTRDDILGWWRMKYPSLQWATEVEGIFYRGD